MSRFVNVDPVKIDSPSRKRMPADLSPFRKESGPRIASTDPAPKLDITKDATSSRMAREQCQSVPINMDRTATSGQPAPSSQTLRAGAKRKFGGEENDGFMVLKQTDKSVKASGAADKARPVQDLQKRRSIKNSSAGKRDSRDKSSVPDAPIINPRKALAAKSTNESPRKVTQPIGVDVSKPAKKANANADGEIKQMPNSATEKPTARPPKKPLPVVQIPSAQPASPAPIPTTSIPTPGTPVPEPDLLTPNTPDHRSTPTTRDTPPPGMGEASRPSRRARPAISYAEPNLRDKMRRPTKELFDAVTGEGKFKARTSMAAPGTAQKPSDEADSAARTTSPGKGKENARPDGGLSVVEMAVAKEASRRDIVLSPTPGSSRDLPVPTTGEDAQLPNSITTERRKRGSSIGRPSMDSLVSSTTSTTRLCLADKPGDAAPAEDAINVYDFESSSPASAEKKVQEPKPAAARAQARRSRASSSFQASGTGSLTSDAGHGVRQNGARGKRASMAAAMTKLSMLELEDTEESSLEGEAVAKDRISRRKSMML